jgi:hypothetical protein
MSFLIHGAPPHNRNAAGDITNFTHNLLFPLPGSRRGVGSSALGGGVVDVCIDTRGRVDSQDSHAMHAWELCNNANGENSTVDNHVDRLVVGDVA